MNYENLTYQELLDLDGDLNSQIDKLMYQRSELSSLIRDKKKQQDLLAKFSELSQEDLAFVKESLSLSPRSLTTQEHSKL